LVVIVFADKQALACGGLSVYTKFCTPSGKTIAVAVRVSNGAGQVTSHAASLSTANGADFNLRA